ncbi:MAG TPA: hypothetical protein VLA76_12090 [Candidatus Angelobacter sp.]|nr:hypothetical protein [Candidatus Angelobacter sp.]
MTAKKQLDERISEWLEAEAPGQMPDRVLRATFERTRKSRQRGGWRAIPGRLSVPKFLSALGSAAVVVVVAALALNLYANQQTGTGTATPTPSAAAASPEPNSSPPTSGGMWPQSTLEEVQEAQDRADAGDPDYTWQVDPVLASFGGPDANGEPLEAEIFERFVREELGWEEFSGFAIHGYVEGGGHLEGVLFIRCAPGRTNPLYPQPYPEMPLEVRGCAPTIDDSRYETVRFNVEQEARTGPSGIWVVTTWELLQPADPVVPYSTFDDLYPDFDQVPVEQVAPPSDAEVSALLQAFLGARVDGEAAETYLHRHEPDEGPPSPGEVVPLLYATTDGARYERSEIERVQGPVWPTGWFEFKVRLFAEDGTVVEQSFAVVRQEDGRLGLVYGSQSGDLPTTENGQAVPVLYSILDGEVTFAAAPPWGDTILNRTFTILGGVGRGSAVQFTMLTVMADPRTGLGCEAGLPAADVDALVRSIRSNPDFEATAPVAARVGGIDALRMDVVGLRPTEVGDCIPLVLERIPGGQDDRVRLYLLDLPEGMSARILVIAISAADSEFEVVVEAAAPVLDSFEFHAP